MVWVKQRLLGSGSYAKVHLAVEPDGKVEIAVKSAEWKNDSDSLIRERSFLYELRGCPHILRYFGNDISVLNGVQSFSLLLEYAPGGTLRQLIQGSCGNMPETTVAQYTYQILEGIHYMHTRGIVHCDLKPDNILVFPGEFVGGGDRLKLCDFGLGKYVGGMNIFGDCHCGTLLYAPPESINHGLYETPKDIWALGCIVGEMFTGKPMCKVRKNPDKVGIQIAFANPEIPDGISPQARDFLKMCLERDPRRRWTAKALLDHPFVRRFAVVEREEDYRFVNPLGCRGWNSSKDQITVRPLSPESTCRMMIKLRKLPTKQNLGGKKKEDD